MDLEQCVCNCSDYKRMVAQKSSPDSSLLVSAMLADLIIDGTDGNDFRSGKSGKSVKRILD